MVISYPLMLNVANDIIESWLFGKIRLSRLKRRLIENLSRTVLGIITVFLAILANDKLDSFVSMIGAFACIPLAFTLPALFHYRLCALTN